MSPRQTLRLAAMLGTFLPVGLPVTLVRAADPADTTDLSLDIDVIARRLDTARRQIQPSLGASVYGLSAAVLQSLPQGDNAPLNQVLLQTPGVAQDSFGQIHLRGEHGLRRTIVAGATQHF